VSYDRAAQCEGGCPHGAQHLEGKRREGNVGVAVESHSDEEHLQSTSCDWLVWVETGAGQAPQTGPGRTRSTVARGMGLNA
jgi:hypothetical protein